MVVVPVCPFKVYSWETLHRGYDLFRFHLTVCCPGANEHHGTSAKRAGIARLAPLHVGKAAEECYEKQVRRYVVGPGRLRVNGDKENGEQGQGANPGNHYVLPNREFGRLFP